MLSDNEAASLIDTDMLVACDTETAVDSDIDMDCD